MSCKSLHQLYVEHTGKVSDKWSLYLYEYERIFNDYRTQSVKIFEVGIQNGGSLEILPKYFVHGVKFVGCDINPDCYCLQFDDPRIAIIIGDANSDNIRDAVLQHSREYDIVIDDGSHQSGDIVKTFANYFPNISEDGVFIAEDLHCSYWREYEGGLFAPYSAITFFKQLADIVNQEHWGIDKKGEDLISGFCEEYGVRLDNKILEQIHSVEFVNSMCIVRKAPSQCNLLGKRFISGNLERIVSGLTNACKQPTIQRQNRWSQSERSPYEELPLRLEELAKRDQQLRKLNLYIKNQDDTIEAITSSKSWRITLPLRKIGLIYRKIRNSYSYQKCFDAEWYLQNNPDVAFAGIDTFKHYSLFGKVEGRMPQNNLAAKKILRAGIKELFVAVRRRGGFARACKKILTVFIREGFAGVKIRLVRIQESSQNNSADYAEWIRRYDTLTNADRRKIRERIKKFKNMPLISVIVPVYDPPVKLLDQAILSVQSQLYQNWELCLADDASSNPAIRKLLTGYSQKDKRIKVDFRSENGHISKASNSALALASGEFVALLDHDDILPEHALFWVANEINNYPDVKLIYSDEDKIDKQGQRYEAYFKSDWNLDLLLSQNMFSHLGVYQTELLRKISGFRVGYEGSQDHDLVLRSLKHVREEQIRHIPRVLYHWRAIAGSTALEVDEKNYAKSAGTRAVNDYLQQNLIPARADSVKFGYRVSYKIVKPYPLVSLIIPTRNMFKLLRQCIESVLDKTSYPNYEIIIIDNGSDDQETLSYLEGLSRNDRIKIIRDERPFNFSALNNIAVKCATGEIIGLLNNDIEVIEPGWMRELVSQTLRPEVGAVGALLLYPDHKVQHAGVIMGIGGVANHAHKNISGGMPGYFCRGALVQSLSAVTGACLFVRKDLYNEVGGLNEDDLAIAYNDIDFCLKLRGKGYRTIWTPYAELYHHESASRGKDETPAVCERFKKEILYMKKRWTDIISYDPAYNPNLTIDLEDFSLAWPPRIDNL